ncbi:la-related protein 1C-like isoform X2 [Durio zibethinus]|uniref:La-related protein 1C-like isoform X2 n=1 Tax=Durio zibethinus TaxID=66656 RepID=A0A6P6B6G6_DURZI|nr:la-related protein 1C-like isoform X2 [Durio zibethinus]
MLSLSLFSSIILIYFKATVSTALSSAAKICLLRGPKLFEQATFSDCSPSKAASSSSSSPPPDISLAADGDSDSNSNNNSAAWSKKPAWNKPSNGVVEVGPVMGAASWPALSESARASPKSLADSSSKTFPDGSLSTSQGPVIPQSTQKQGTSNANSNSVPNRTMSGRQRSSKRGGGGGNNSASGPPQSSFSHQHLTPPPPSFPVIQMLPNSYGNFVPAMPDTYVRDPQYRGNNWETRPASGFASQSHNDHRHSSRRGGNYGLRGDSGYHNNFGGRRDQDRGNYGNARDVHMHPQRASPRGFPRPPPPSAHTYVPPQPVRPFVNPIGYPELIYFPTMPMEPFRGMPLITPAPPAMIMPVPELPLPAMILNQIHYYFSDANLIRDEFLKSKMDDQGWVAISLIAGFPRVKSLTSNIQLILDSLRSSTVVEVQDDRVRRRNEWKKWIPSRVSTESGFVSPGGPSSDMLASSFQQITVKEESANQSKAGNVNPHVEDTSERNLSKLIGRAQLPNGEGSKDTCLD